MTESLADYNGKDITVSRDRSVFHIKIYEPDSYGQWLAVIENCLGQQEVSVTARTFNVLWDILGTAVENLKGLVE